MARPFRIIDSSNPEWELKWFRRRHSDLCADLGFRFPDILLMVPSQYDLTIAGGHHFLPNDVDTEDICGKEAARNALKKSVRLTQ